MTLLFIYLFFNFLYCFYILTQTWTFLELGLYASEVDLAEQFIIS